MKLFTAIATLLALTLTVSAHADDSKKSKKSSAPAAAESYGGAPWGMAGCSIWNYVIKEKDQGPQIGVWALEHIVFGVQPNCVDQGKMSAQNEQEVFVNVNMASLQKEAAQGQGDHLATLAEIFGCSDKGAFAQMSQNRYEAIFTNEKPADIVQSYKNELKTSKMSAACSRAG